MTFSDIAYPLHYPSFFVLFLFFSLFIFFSGNIYILFPKTGFSSSLSELGIPFHTSRICDDLTQIQEMSNILSLGYTELEYVLCCMHVVPV
jgi:hypothetical protein